MVLHTSKNQTIEIFFGTTKQYHAMENHTMEIHVSRGLTIIVLKKLSDLKWVGTGLNYAKIVMKHLINK